MAMLAARPFDLSFDPARAALIVIDMQRDLIEPGGFGATLANDATPLQAIMPTARRLLTLARRHGLPVIRQIIGAADGMSLADAFRGIYRLAELKRRTGPLLTGVDLLCVPMIPTIYSVEDLEADPNGANARLGTCTNFVNLLDLSRISVPVARRGRVA